MIKMQPISWLVMLGGKEFLQPPQGDAVWRLLSVQDAAHVHHHAASALEQSGHEVSAPLDVFTSFK